MKFIVRQILNLKNIYFKIERVQNTYLQHNQIATTVELQCHFIYEFIANLDD